MSSGPISPTTISCITRKHPGPSNNCSVVQSKGKTNVADQSNLFKLKCWHVETLTFRDRDANVGWWRTCEKHMVENMHRFRWKNWWWKTCGEHTSHETHLSCVLSLATNKYTGAWPTPTRWTIDQFTRKIKDNEHKLIYCTETKQI